MSRRFFIAASGLNTDQEKAVRDYLDENGAWWHWIANFWLFNTDSTEITCANIRDAIQAICSTSRILVMEVQPDIDWAAMGPKDNKQDMFKWLKKSWPS